MLLAVLGRCSLQVGATPFSFMQIYFSIQELSYSVSYGSIVTLESDLNHSLVFLNVAL